MQIINLIYKFLLPIHIVSGSIALVIGTIVMVLKKRNQLHQKNGQFFAFSLLISAVASVLLALIKNSDFLLAIGLLTIYCLLSGKRYLKIRQLAFNQKVTIYDWLLCGYILITGFLLLILAFRYSKNSGGFNLVLLLFSIRALSYGWVDFRTFLGYITKKNYWLLQHIDRMVTAYIASFTAFLVVQNIPLFGIWAWILPSMVFVPLLVFWRIKNSGSRIEK